ncbi:WD repeat-containing protein 63-like isoform X2 [Nasonia vitripennis]|uniref:WD repeat-containing protein 63 n=1 Tax=Nasonia vitripennis TaxID=7425 RepID=A0A7M7J1Q1_NASVI|nr:WD repeat-containing protein 63-like isoform X2 [Nasonia vitripennis]
MTAPSLKRTPPRISGAEIVRLTRQQQLRLGCAVEVHVFLECPYAFVPRKLLLEEANETLAAKIKAFDVDDLLLGYSKEKIETEDYGDFLVCLTEESTRALVFHNRRVTKNLLDRVRDEIIKQPRPWLDQGSGDFLNDAFLRSNRPLHEIDVALPVSELRRRRKLTDRPPDHPNLRDGYIELVPVHESFEHVELTRIEKTCQTNLEGRDVVAQTYPGNPKNQWTQYELEIPEDFVEIWTVVEKEEQENPKDEQQSERSSSSSNREEEKKPTKEEIQLLQKRRSAEWCELNDFLKKNSCSMIDVVAFNASTNLHTNDVANLDGAALHRDSIFVESPGDYEEKVSLIDLKSVGDRYLISASWHCEMENVIVCAYLDPEAMGQSLLALWSLDSPLRPRALLKCEERLAVVSFCPLKGFANVIVGGCADGKIVVWEINERMLTGEDVRNRTPPLIEATIAASGEKSQTRSVTMLQWLPPWCRLETDGNFQRNTGNSRKAYFVTSSFDGSVFFWSLPPALSNPAELRSPLHLTISPIYQLIVEDQNAKTATRIPITCFSLPLAKNEESSNLSIRDQADLERLRRIFLGTSLGEVLCCSWESQTFAVDLTDRESCKVIGRCCWHDGIVRSMTKSPHLDDVFLTVGGRVFALWKEDLAEAPIFQRRSSDCGYGEGCWTGRSGLFAIARLDGCFEVWDLKRSSEKPVLLQTVSGKVSIILSSFNSNPKNYIDLINVNAIKLSASIYPNPTGIAKNLLAVLDGPSTLRIFVEPIEKVADEDLERVEWFEEFAWRETKRKLDFSRWQDDYLRQHPTALRRKAEREQAEATRKHREAREKFLKEQEILARQEAERKLARRRVSKSAIWRQNEEKRAESILLQKKNFVPSELDEKRRPLVELEEQRRTRSRKIREQLSRADKILEKKLVREVPEARQLVEPVTTETSENSVEKKDEEKRQMTSEDHEAEYRRMKEEMETKMRTGAYTPSFDWAKAMLAGEKRMKQLNNR